MDGVSMNRQRLEGIQVLRAFAFLAIFLSHTELTDTGTLGVSVFLVLSGFCMVYAYLAKTEKLFSKLGLHENISFAARKIKKLYPLHILALLAVAVIQVAPAILNNNLEFKQVFYFICNGLLVQSWIPTKEGYFSFNAVSWYLSVMAFIYFAFPFIIRFVASQKRKRILWSAGIIILLQFTVALACTNISSTGFSDNFIKWVCYICPVYRLGDFFLGCVAGYIFLNYAKEHSEKVHTVIECFSILLVLLQLYIYCSCYIPDYIRYDLYWLPSSLVLVYAFAANKGFVTQKLVRSKALVQIGNLSGQAFLVHQIVIKFVGFVVENKIVLSIFALLLTLVSTTVYLYIEKWIIRSKTIKRDKYVFKS